MHDGIVGSQKLKFNVLIDVWQTFKNHWFIEFEQKSRNFVGSHDYIGTIPLKLGVWISTECMGIMWNTIKPLI